MRHKITNDFIHDCMRTGLRAYNVWPMSKETLGIVLAVVVGVMGFAIWLADEYGKATPTLMWIVLLVMAGLCLCGIYLIPWLWNAQTLREKIGRPASATVLVLIAVSYFGFWVSRPHALEDRKKAKEEPELHPESIVAVFAKCDIAGLPIEIPPQDAIRVVPVNKRRMTANDWGSLEISNNDKKVKQWPEKAQLDLSRRLNDSGATIGYICELSNHGNVNLFDVRLTMRFSFLSEGKEGKDDVDFTPIISPLDTGHSFILYFFNDCPHEAVAVLPDTVTVTVAGEKTRRTTKLNMPNRYSAERVMHWAPTKVSWAGWSANGCE
jgi:hypothetical protein